MKTLIFLTLSLLFFAKGYAAENLLEVIKQQLPKKIREITIGRSTRPEVLNKFGKALSGSNSQRIFFQFSPSKGDTNNLTVNFKKDIVSAIYFEHDFSFNLDDLKQFLSADELAEAIMQNRKKQVGHSAGRFLEIDLAKYALKLKFTLGEKQTLRSIIFYSTKGWK
jgi:hypothetical protein